MRQGRHEARDRFGRPHPPGWAATNRVRITRSLIAALCLVCVSTVLSCRGTRPSSLGISNARLAPCPSSPNCVSSDSSDPSRRVEALLLSASPDAAWPVIRDAVASLPRTTVVEETADYLHAQCTSALFGFVDDLELHLRASANSVAVRSASRVGYFDLRVNRRRVERLREILRLRAVVR